MDDTNYCQSGKSECKKKLLIYAHYYVPDVASTGQILRDLAEGMLDFFHVTVICVVPSYSGKVSQEYKTQKYYYKNINGVDVIRIRVPEFSKTHRLSRIKNILTYFIGAIIATLKVGKIDYVFSISQPPILGGLLGVWGKYVKHAKLIYNIQDINPEQIMAIKYSSNKLLINIMMFFDKYSCRKSDLVITVGRDLVDTLENRFKSSNYTAGLINGKITLINNWIDEKIIYPLPKDDEKVNAFKRKYGLIDKYIIMYSGNMGYYYDLENVFKVIERFKPGTCTVDGREVVFAFIGEGAVYNNLVIYKKSHHMDNVVFIPYQKKENLIYSLNAGDVHLCVNAKGIKGVSCPSKYYGIAAVQAPVLAVLEKKSEIRCIIEETKGGIISDPGDYEALEKNIQWFIDHAGSKDISEMGKRSRRNLLKNLSRDISINKYKEAILKC